MPDGVTRQDGKAERLLAWVRARGIEIHPSLRFEQGVDGLAVYCNDALAKGVSGKSFRGTITSLSMTDMHAPW